MTPTVRRTWAPRGHTPVIHHWDRRDRVSAISAVTVSPQRQHVGLYLHLYPDNLTHVEVAIFLRHLLRHLRGHVVLVWDRGPIHHGRAITALCRRHRRLHLFALPGYAPELNPDEGVWAYAKGALANGCGLGRQDVTAALDLQLVVARHRDDWDVALAAFRNASAPCEALFADWRLDASERSIGATGWTKESAEPTWVQWLIDATRADAPGLFMEPVRLWLADPRRAPMASGQRRSAFATLALDVDGAGELERRCPTLHRLLSRERDGVREVDAVRRQWLERLGGFALLPDVLACCRAHARSLVPDPADARASNYEECATWVAAIRELDPDVYRTILAAWSVAHKRDGTSGRHSASQGLPLPPA